jgi:hypothetical protein
MTESTSTKAEQRVPVLHKLSEDTQEYGTDNKLNVERFVWEFLANRSFTGEPHSLQGGDGKSVGCSYKNKCPDSEVRQRANVRVLVEINREMQKS